ncbi:hypothetical protein Tco_0867638 [Tanacetum coccineum]
MEEVSLTIDEAKLRKMADEMLRQRCTSGDEHWYHIDQMKNFLRSDIVWESRKEILVSPHPRKTTPLLSTEGLNLTAPTIAFPGIEEHDMFSIIYEPVHGIIYKNNLTKDETEYLKLFEEEIEERLKHRRQMRRWEMVLAENVVRSLSALTYYRDLDKTTLRDLIDSDGKLISKDPQPGVPRVGIPRPLRASMQDLYDRMGRMKIRQDAIERIEYRQSYHWDRYHGVFEHMAGVYSVPLQGAYNPPGYAQPQYDQYYQQYPPPPPQYQPQQRQDDDE